MPKYNWKKNIIINNGIHIFHYGRRLGKTEEIYRLARNDPNGIMIVYNHQMVRALRDRFPSMENRIYCPNDIHGWSSSITARGHNGSFMHFNYYVDEVTLMPKEFVCTMVYYNRLKALSFTDASENYMTREGEQHSWAEILKKIIDRNKKTYYHKAHDENSQLYRRITRYTSTARAELMPGYML